MRSKIKSSFYKKRTTRKDKAKLFTVLKGVLLILLSAFSLIFVYVWLNIAVVRKGYLLSARKKEKKQLEQKNKELKLEVSELKSLERIEKIARGKLKLSEPKESEILWIKR